MEQLEVRKAEAKVKEEACSIDEADCANTMRVVSEIKDECQRELDEAIPALNAANKALNNLEKKDIVEIKSYTKPPELVEKVINAVLLLFDRKQSWDEGKKMVSDIDFLRKCIDYPKDDIKNATLRKLQAFTADPVFNARTIANVSLAASSLCEWVNAMDKYAKIARNVEPKR